jgi:sugar/nucleoside kinase (ribokinase family)
MNQLESNPQLPYDVIVLGDYFYDLIFSGLEAFPELGQEKYSRELVTTGGAAYTTVRSLHRLGARVGWRGHFGNDEYSREIYQLAANEGIDMQLARIGDQPYRRVTTALPLSGERAFVTYADPRPTDLFDFRLEALVSSNYRHVHLTGALSPEKLTPFVTAARAAGATLSMDCQDVALLYTNCEWQKLVGMVDVFMPNAREARLIAKTDDLDAAMRLLLDWGQVIVIKDGAAGALVGKGKGAYMRVPGINAGVCVDSTGAGDCFNAGFLYGYVCEGAPLELCARYGNICGGLSVTREGGATHAPDLTTLRAWAEQS